MCGGVGKYIGEPSLPPYFAFSCAAVGTLGLAAGVAIQSNRWVFSVTGRELSLPWHHLKLLSSGFVYHNDLAFDARHEERGLSYVAEEESFLSLNAG